ncbi:MAG: hypothetical protein ACRDYY_17850 [Acidimicrobiales bacterium]
MSPPNPSQQPPSGYMRLFDAALPPLLDGNYRLTVSSHITQTGLLDETLDRQRYFNVEGPRFTLDPGLVAGVFPPKGAHGPFADSLPQIVLNRRTLPWERSIANTPVDPLGSGGAMPWLVLLLFSEGEYTLLDQQPLETVLPKDAISPMPSGVRCDALQVKQSLLTAVMPARSELELLAHVRQVNIEDRELNTSRGDGWFSVVVGNCLPEPGAKQRAFLVSLEGRGDLVPAQPPPVPPDLIIETGPSLAQGVSLGFEIPGGSDVTALGAVARGPQRGNVPVVVEYDPTVTLVCLYSWEFTCEGDASFEQLMQGLDVGMFGASSSGQPVVSDSGHIAMQLTDRAGERQTAWYRGPLVPYAMSRDDQGPYHSADQARRVTPDTGVEDVSYSSAFDLGRLLAVADGRLAQELMRWRRQGFAASIYAGVVSQVRSLLPGLDATLSPQLETAMTPVVGAGVAGEVGPHIGPVADAAGLDAIMGAPGLNPSLLQAAWGLSSTAEAVSVLDGTAGVSSLGQGVTGPADLASAAADTAGQARLAAARNQAITNAVTAIEGAP